MELTTIAGIVCLIVGVALLLFVPQKLENYFISFKIYRKASKDKENSDEEIKDYKKLTRKNLPGFIAYFLTIYFGIRLIIAGILLILTKHFFP